MRNELTVLGKSCCGFFAVTFQAPELRESTSRCPDRCTSCLSARTKTWDPEVAKSARVVLRSPVVCPGNGQNNVAVGMFTVVSLCPGVFPGSFDL